MKESSVDSLDSEEKELQKKLRELAELESELSQRELDLATLEAEISNFESQYLRTVGVRYAELDEVRARIAEARARLRPEDRRAREEAEAAESRARESAKEAASATQEEPRQKFRPSEALKKLFREMARMLHPDLATDEEERKRRHVFMINLNLAYEKGDEQRMREILQEWKSEPHPTESGDIGDALGRMIRKIAQAEKRLSDISIQIERLFESEVYQLYLKVEDAAEGGRDLLAEMASEIEAEIRTLKAEGFDILWQVMAQVVGTRS